MHGGSARSGASPPVAMMSESGAGPETHKLRPPSNVVPGILPLGRILGRSEQVVVTINALFVYLTGVEIDLCVLCHPSIAVGPDSVFGGAAEDLRSGRMLVLDVELPGGVHARTSDGYDTCAEAVALPRAASGDGSRYDLRYWVSPLPTDGAITIGCEWPAFAVSGHIAVDVAALRSSVPLADALWEDSSSGQGGSRLGLFGLD